MTIELAECRERLDRLVPFRFSGRVVRVTGLLIEASGLLGQVEEICHIYAAGDGRRISAEVVGFNGDRVFLMPFGDMQGVSAGCQVQASGRPFTIAFGRSLLGRVLDGLGNPIDGLGPLPDAARAPLRRSAPSPLARRPISQPLETGIRAIDGMLTCGRGQRVGIFAGSGVGKSTLMGMIARSVHADVNVIALIGERGREVQEFIRHSLGEEGLRRSVVVVSTSDQPALLRIKAAWVATAIAEHFCQAGSDVNLMMDSLTRFAMAQREIGLAVGEPPALKGYPPSVFALLPRLLERTGTAEVGTITGFYTILVEGDDTNEPISDTVRSILDGHIVLSREHAAENHYPAIDVLQSVSRIMPAVVTPEHRQAAARLREVLATYRNVRDLVQIGAYQTGSSREIDRALRLLPAINALLRQGETEVSSWAETVGRLEALVGDGVAS